MRSFTKTIALGALLASVFTGCTTIDPYTGEQRASKTTAGAGIGAFGGAALGAIVGGGRGAAIGAVLGGASGAVIGNSMDRQDAMLRQRLKGTGVQVTRTRDGIQLVMASDVTFANNSADIKSGFYQALDSVAIVLKRYNETNIVVSGYTSSTGDATYNQKLSERRAHSVGEYLISQGIRRNRVFTQGFGQRYPVASNDTAQGQRLNRRVVITLRPMA